MTYTRREFLSYAAATAGAVTVLPYWVHAAGHEGDSFADGLIMVHPVSHASFVMTTPAGTIYCDPAGEAAQYAEFGAPDLVLITHQHGDHYVPDTLAAILADNSKIICNPAVHEIMPDAMKAKATAIGNGESTSFGDVGVDAIPAYNMTEERLNFHPKGRDNGYVLNFGGFRVYVSGDTEDIAEMRGLQNINLAFVCMNLPFTMDAKAAASAVAEFKPEFVYPYHYRGRGEGGTQDPAKFARLVGDASDVRMGDWYG